MNIVLFCCVVCLVAILLITIVIFFHYSAYAKTSNHHDTLQQILKELKLQTALSQDNTEVLLKALHNNTAQLQVANIYAQNMMVESHNAMARLLQALHS